MNVATFVYICPLISSNSVTLSMVPDLMRRAITGPVTVIMYLSYMDIGLSMLLFVPRQLKNTCFFMAASTNSTMPITASSSKVRPRS